MRDFSDTLKTDLLTPYFLADLIEKLLTLHVVLSCANNLGGYKVDRNRTEALGNYIS